MAYVVLFGQEGVSEEFQSLSDAKARANILKQIHADVSIDKVSDYSQSQVMRVSGKNYTRQDYLKEKIRKKQSGVPSFKEMMGGLL